MKNNKKTIKIKINDFRLLLYTDTNKFLFNLITDDSLFFKTLLNHFTKNDYYIDVSLKDLKILRNCKWV